MTVEREKLTVPHEKRIAIISTNMFEQDRKVHKSLSQG